MLGVSNMKFKVAEWPGRWGQGVRQLVPGSNLVCGIWSFVFFLLFWVANLEVLDGFGRLERWRKTWSFFLNFG